METTARTSSRCAAWGIALKNKHFKGLSVKWILLLILLTMTVSTLGLMYLAQTVFLDKVYQVHKESEMFQMRDQLLQTQSSKERIEKASELGRKYIACIAIYEYEHRGGLPRVTEICNYESTANCNCMIHRMLTSSGKEHFRPDKMRMVIDSIEATLSENKSWLLVSASEEEQSITGNGMTGLALDQSGEKTVAYFINTSTIPMATTVKTANTLLWYVGLIVIGSTVIVSLILALWIAVPIGRLNVSAKKLAKYDYNVHFSGKGYKEVSELSDTLNHTVKELSRVDMMQRELLANISHDLRTPVTLITGYAEAMRDLPSEMTEENLGVIIEESNRMKVLVNDILEISKIKEGVLPLRTEEFDFTNAILTELTRYNKLREREGYLIDFKFDQTVTVRGDRSQLLQVVYNLVNNGVNYTGKDKRVTVTQTVHKNRVRISVTDSGEGIPADQLPLIWDRYYKVDKTHKRATAGSGLGLSIVKQIVSAHNGSCGVQSSPSVGSTFWFELEIC